MNGHQWFDARPITSPDEDLFDYPQAAALLAKRLRATYRGNGRPGARSLVVALEGAPGWGKTSFSNLVVGELGEPEAEASPQPVLLDLADSASEALSIWAATAYRIGEAFYTRLHRRCLADEDARPIRVPSPAELGRQGEPTWLQVDVKGLREERLHWIEVAWRFSQAVSPRYWAPCLKLFNDAPSKVPGRRLGWSESRELLVTLGEGALHQATGNAGKAIGAAAAGARGLLKRPLVEGPSWGVDTAEFVGELDRLLRVLHPTPADWRAVVVFDGLSTLEPAKLQELRAAIGFLRRLEAVLVVLDVDAPPAGREASAPAGRPLDRSVDLRVAVPAPNDAELFEATQRLVEKLGLSLSTLESSKLVRYLRGRGVNSPRQTKQALLWLSTHLAGEEPRRSLLEDGKGEALSAEHRQRILELLVDLHLFLERRLPARTVFTTAEAWPAVLGHFPVQPWNFRSWLDRQETNLAIWSGRRRRPARDIVLELRLLTLGRFLGLGDAMLCHETRLRALWRDLREWIAGDDPFRLKGMGEDTAEALATHLEAKLDPKSKPRRHILAEGLAFGLLLAAARRFDAAPPPDAIQSPLRLEESWFDSDLLVTRLELPETEAETRRLTWVLLNFFHPTVAARLGDRIESSKLWSDGHQGLLTRLRSQREALLGELGQGPTVSIDTERETGS